MFMPAVTSALWSLVLLLVVVVPQCLGEVGLLPFGTAVGDSLVTSASSSYTTGSFAIPFPGRGPTDFFYSFSLTAVDAIFYGKFRVSLHSDAPFATPGTTNDGVGVPGIYRRQVSASLSTLYADLLPNGLLFSPTTALVMTFYKMPSSTFPSEIMSVQVVILWNSVTYIVLFRMNELGPHINLVGGLFSIASNSYLYELPTVNATTTNVGVAGLLAFPPELVARTPTPSTSHSVDSSGSRTLSFHAWGLSHSATAAISMSVSHSASRTASASSPLTPVVARPVLLGHQQVQRAVVSTLLLDSRLRNPFDPSAISLCIRNEVFSPWACEQQIQRSGLVAPCCTSTSTVLRWKYAKQTLELCCTLSYNFFASSFVSPRRQKTKCNTVTQETNNSG